MQWLYATELSANEAITQGKNQKTEAVGGVG